MALNHMNLPVSDPVGMQQFLEKYLGMKSKRPGNAKMALLTDENDMQLLLMGPDLSGSAVSTFPNTFHIGFRQQSNDDVNSIYRKLVDDGIDVAEPEKIHGAYAFYIRTQWGVMIEVVA